MDDLFTYATEHACRRPGTALQAPCAPGAPDTAGIEPPAEFARLVAAVAPCLGEAAAKTAWAVAQEAGIGEGLGRLNRERRVRHLVEVWFEAFPWPVCALATGYFRPVTVAEIAHYDAALSSRIVCMFRRRSTFRRHCRRAGFDWLGRGRWSDPSTPSTRSTPSTPAPQEVMPIAHAQE